MQTLNKIESPDQEERELFNKGINVTNVAEFMDKKRKQQADHDRQETNKSLLEIIARQEAKAESPQEQVNEEIALNSKRMSVNGAWVPLCMKKAHKIVNNPDSPPLRLQMYTKCDHQPAFGPVLKGWKSVEHLSEYLIDALKRIPLEMECTCSLCPPKYTTQQVFENDRQVNLERDPWHYRKQGRG